MAALLDPAALLPPHRVTRPEQVEELAADMQNRGWRGADLIGYRLHGQHGPVQLLSGTHRQAAAKSIGMHIPVVIYNRATVERAYGDLERWHALMSGELDDLC